MPYVKDNLGNSVWVAGDDTSQQQEKMAGIERHNIFRSPASVVGGSVQDVKPASSKPGTVSQPVTPTQPVQQTAVTKSQGTVTGGIQNRPSITSTEELARAMGYTSPEEENRLRRASVANQRLLALTDALRHIGNIHNTVNGAPSQTFNSPVEAEVARYKQDKAIRDAANARYLSYQQQKAAQEAKMQALSDATEIKMKQLAFNQDKFNRQQSLNEFKAKNDAWYKQATIEQKAEYLDIQRQLMEGRISLMDAQRALAEVKTAAGGFAPKSGGRGGSSKGMDEYTTTTETSFNYDENGRKTGSTTRRSRTVNRQTQPTVTTDKNTNPGFGGTVVSTPAGTSKGKQKIQGFGGN